MIRLLGFLANIVFVFSMFASASPSLSETKPLIVTSVRPLALLLNELCFEVCEVKPVMPGGTDEHGYNPSAKELVGFKDAKLIIGVGLGFDERVIKTLAKTVGSSATLVWLGERLKPIEFSLDKEKHRHHHDHHHDHSNEHGSFDPHVWFDPLRMVEAVGIVSEKLRTILPKSVDKLAANEAKLLESLRNLDKKLTNDSKNWPNLPLIVMHDALGYFKSRYGLNVRSTVGGGAGHEMSPKDFVRMVKEHQSKLGQGAAAVVVEKEDGSSRNLAKALSTKILILDLSLSHSYKTYHEWLSSLSEKLMSVSTNVTKP
jgi:zinc transport system substrate-binding protein